MGAKIQSSQVRVAWLLGGIIAAWAAMTPCLDAFDDTLPNFNAPQDDSPLDVDKVNRLMGVSLFKADSLWDEDEAEVAKRLAWPAEGRTSHLASYRLYPAEDKPVAIFGARAYSCVLYAEQGKPSELSIVFANRGDYEWGSQAMKDIRQHFKPHGDDDSSTSAPADATHAAPVAPDVPTTSSVPDTTPGGSLSQYRLSEDDITRIQRDVRDGFGKALKSDSETLSTALTKLFGPPDREGFGGGTETREHVLRWDWQGHAFLLASPKDEYVTLRIVPVSVAESGGKAEQLPHEELAAALEQRVQKSDNGDIVIGDIPMVDQGPKGYCVPATWERYLRYVGIPADMYVLAMAAGSSPSQGTNLELMVQGVDSLVSLYHRRIEVLNGPLDLPTISKRVDHGLPIMWTCCVFQPFDHEISQRTELRGKVTDWDDWSASLQPARAWGDKMKSIGMQPNHQRMIIGYNEKTNEVAISDSWADKFAKRWMTLEEANAINGGQSFVIDP